MATYYNIDESTGPSLLTVLPSVLWQRKWLIILPALLGGIIGTTAAYIIPPMYESTATVLIESQQLPMESADLNSLSDLIDQRIARARERVLSRQVLIQLIRSNGLYPKEQQQGTPFSAIVDKMRDNTTISGVASDAGGPRNFMQGKQTIALRIAFDYPDPIKTQAVTQQFVNRFLEVDATSQTEQAQGADVFLGEQASQISGQIGDIENKINKIKTDNGSVLALGAQSTGDPIADASRIDSEIAGLQAQSAQLAAQAGASGGESAAVTDARRRLAEAQSRLSETHPDVIAAKQALAAVMASAAAPSSNGAVTAQINSIRSQIGSLQSAKAMLLSQSSTARSAAARAPTLQAQIDQLEKQAEVKRDQLRVIGMRSQNASINAKMQVEQKGERLTLADPPIVPDAPFKPDRKILIAGALSGGIGLGLAIILGLELLLRPIRGVDAVKAATGAPPLAIVPDYERKPNFILRWLERRNRKKADAKARKSR